MHKPKLMERYTILTNDEVSAFGHSVVRQTTASTFITKGGDLVKPLNDALTAYDTFVAGLDYPSPAQTAHADGLRNEVRNQLGRLAKRLNLDYTAQEAPLRSSGLTMANPNMAARPESDTTPVLTLLDGRTAGCLLLRFAGFTGSVQKLIRYSTDPDLDPKHWLVAVGGGRDRELGPFASGTKVFVMAAPLMGSTQEPAYSVVVSRIVQ